MAEISICNTANGFINNFLLVVVNTISSVQAYDQIKILTQGGPSGSTRTLLYLFFQQGFEQFDMGSATAIAFII